MFFFFPVNYPGLEKKIDYTLSQRDTRAADGEAKIHESFFMSEQSKSECFNV